MSAVIKDLPLISTEPVEPVEPVESIKLTQPTEPTLTRPTRQGRPVGTSKAPTVKPPRQTIKSLDGLSTTYIYYSPRVLKNGKTVYHKRTHTRYYKGKPADGIIRRPNSVKRDTEHKRKIKKRKLMNDFKAQVLLSDISVDQMMFVYSILNLPLPAFTHAESVC
jgi:hypothetical protein